MQTTLPSARLSPLSYGLMIAGGLFFVVVVVVRATLAQSSGIDAATAAGRAAVQLPLQNSVADALPAFSLQPTTAPTVPTGAGWLEVMTTAGDLWVWADAWFSCRYVEKGGAYYAIGNAYDVTGWPTDEQFQALPAITRRDISEVCHGQ